MKLLVTDEGHLEVAEGSLEEAGVKPGDRLDGEAAPDGTITLRPSPGKRQMVIDTDERTGLPVVRFDPPIDFSDFDVRRDLEEIYEERARLHAGLTD